MRQSQPSTSAPVLRNSGRWVDIAVPKTMTGTPFAWSAFTIRVRYGRLKVSKSRGLSSPPQLSKIWTMRAPASTCISR